MHNQPSPVTLSASGKTSKGEVQIVTFSNSERTVRALKVLGICWGIGLFSILIPVLHFVLPPIFLLAGPIVGLMRYSIKSKILEGQGICPICAADFKITPTKATFPLDDICEACHRHVLISPLS